MKDVVLTRPENNRLNLNDFIVITDYNCLPDPKALLLLLLSGDYSHAWILTHSFTHSPPHATMSTVVSIRFKNNDGYGQSITHYYHFLFAALFPLIDYHIKNPSHKVRVVTDVGPMKRFLCEMPLGVVELLSEKVKPGASGGETSNGNKRSAHGMSSINTEITLPGYDNFGQSLFDANDWVLDRFKKGVMSPVLSFFEESIPPYLLQSPSVRRIILIERKTEAYFKQAYADKQPSFWTSGSQRRSILNHDELSNALKEKFGEDFASVSLEGTSVSFQYLLFSRAQIVIAQHGGALSNVVFMNAEKGHVVEISPPWGRDDNHFRNLSEFKGVGYERVLQSGDHSNVDVSEVCRVVSSLMTGNDKDENKDCSTLREGETVKGNTETPS